MKKLHLGPVSLPLDIITMRTLGLGVSGSGKSAFGRLLAEQIHGAGQRFCVIDLKNDWWGLKSSASGKRAAIPLVIIGGPRADIPLDPDGGAAVADIVAELPHSFVLDLDSLSKGKGIKFLGAFLERLYDVNRDPILLICDEADRYGPQKPMSVEANVTLGAADDIARRGRKRGIGSLWLSQRPAVINKNITSQCEVIVTFRTVSALDQKELREHIGRVATKDQVDAVMRDVGGLENGQAIFMSQHPEVRIFRTAQLPMPATFDSSATPRVGQRRIEPKELAAPDLAALSERIKSTVEKAKADDPKALRAEVARIRMQLKAEIERNAALQYDLVNAKQKTTATPKRVDVLSEKQIARIERAAEKFATAAEDARRAGAYAGDAALEVKRVIGTVKARAANQALDGSWQRQSAPPTRSAIEIPDTPTPASVGQRGNGHNVSRMPVGMKRTLTALAQYPDGLTRERLTILTGYKRSTRDLYIRQLISAQLADDSANGVIRATLVGIGTLGHFEPLPTGDALQSYWLAKLPQGEKALLEALLPHGTQAVDRDRLSEVTGYKRSTRDLYLRKLAARQIIETSGAGVSVRGELFDHGAA